MLYNVNRKAGFYRLFFDREYSLIVKTDVEGRKKMTTDNNAIFKFFNQNGTEAAYLTPPICEFNGRELRLSVKSCGETAAEYEGFGMEAHDTVTERGNGVWVLEREVKNTSRSTRTFKLISELNTSFEVEKYTIPCVSYDGNARSGGGEARGCSLDGELWIHAYDRIAIPSCTIAEREGVVSAFFASEADRDSLRTSAAFRELEDGTMSHRIYYPVTEAPYTYSDHDVMSPRYDEYITLEPFESFKVFSYIYTGVPRWKNYGTAEVLDAALDLFDNLHDTPLTPEVVRDTSIAWSQYLLADVGGVKMFRNALRHSKTDDGLYMPYPVYEAGWSGQCMQQARMFILEYIRTGTRHYLDDALSCFDAWIETQKECGLFPTNYIRHLTGKYVPIDVCNFSWGAIETVRAYKLLRSIGIDRPRYVEFAKRILDFLISQYNDTDGFGLSYTMSGEKVQGGGSIGGFTVMALVEYYKLTGEREYLDIAERAYLMYAERDLDDFICTAGAIDCACIDKETAYPFIYSALELYEITKKAVYLEYAQKSAYYFFSWAYHYDALYDEDSDFIKYGYYTSGGTAVSTQHHAIDPWGEIAVPDFVKIAELTGDARWRKRAKMMWNNAILCITTDPNGEYKLGHYRPYGTQSEAFFGCRWTRYRPHCEERGHINDMFVGWVSAYRLSALERMAGACAEGIDFLR